MKLHHTLLLTLAVLGYSHLTVQAQDEADRQALRQIRTNYMDAVNSGDLTKIKNNLATNVTGVMVTGKPVAGYDDLVAYWKEIQALIGPGGSYHCAVNVDKTDLYGDIAVSRGTTDESVHLPNGTDLDFNGYWTAVCHKEGDTWKVVRMQATLDPVHNVFITLQLKRAQLTYGLVGFTIGIIAALFIRSILPRKRHNM